MEFPGASVAGDVPSDARMRRVIAIGAKLRPVGYRPILWNSSFVVPGRRRLGLLAGEFLHFERKPSRQLVIAKEAMNTKCAGARMADGPGHCSQTLNSYFFSAVVRSR